MSTDAQTSATPVKARIRYRLPPVQTGTVRRTLRLATAAWEQFSQLCIDQRTGADTLANDLLAEGIALMERRYPALKEVPRFPFKPTDDYYLAYAPGMRRENDRKVNIDAAHCLRVRQMAYVRSQPLAEPPRLYPTGAFFSELIMLALNVRNGPLL
ncbi:MAG: hypothetical protein RLZZ324_723 [Candidatus Parcubacteria bacterium]|jgi:hypothetical protein